MKIPKALVDVAQRLGPLRSEVVFVGGMIRDLLITDPGAGASRPTDDVDLIIDVRDLSAYHHHVARTLRELGHRECTDEGSPLCRWIVDGIKVDVMPVDPNVLGFSNAWYADAIQRAVPVSVGGGEIKRLSAPDFVATKLEAFKSRGEGDLYHRDLEDVVAVVDGRVELAEELRGASPAVRRFVAAKIEEFLASDSFLDALPGHLEGDEASQARLPLLLRRLRALASLLRLEPTAAARPGRRQEWAQRGASSPSAVRSSNIREVAYTPSTETLTVTFHSGTVYAYHGVPPTIHRGLLDAASKGRYHYRWIRNRYRYERIR